jgi:hypothetical protein
VTGIVNAMRKTGFIFLITIAILSLSGVASAEVYSIYDIQYTTDSSGESPLKDQVIDCLGGIVTHKFNGFRPKLTIQDPNFPLGWGAVQVKDWLVGAPLYAKASVGDRVTLTNVEVEEYSGGGTILQCYEINNPDLTVISSNNPLPQPLPVDVNEIAAPLYQTAPEGWLVQDRGAEKYEAMFVTIRNVTVTEKDNGKAMDNYTLQSNSEPNNPNYSCWAADYMNIDASGDYHPLVEIDQHFCGVTGIIEHYKGYKNYYEWDYYQLLTTKTDDFLIAQPADFDDDCDVDFLDYSYFAQYWFVECNSDPNCSKADMAENGIVDVNDFGEFIYNWLDGIN